MKRILFIDDEPHQFVGLQRMLPNYAKEWQMYFTNCGKQALTWLDAEPFDVIVTDVRVPEMDGAKFLEHVQERHPSVVRIVLSGHVELEAAMLAAPAAHQFLSKPCDPEKLRSAIQRACECRANSNDEEMRGVVGIVGKLPSLPVTCDSLLNAFPPPRGTYRSRSRTTANGGGYSAAAAGHDLSQKKCCGAWKYGARCPNCPGNRNKRARQPRLGCVE